MSKIILVVDIETTGFLHQGGKIVEIAIVKLDLETGIITPAYSSLIKEPGFDISHTKGSYGWIFKNSNLTFKEVEFAPSLESQREIIQGLFNEYQATAYNKEFDFGFLLNRKFKINELPCPMLLATPILNLPSDAGFSSPKWPKVEEAWNYFFKKVPYNQAHRGLDDAKHEANITFELYKLGQFEVNLENNKTYDYATKTIQNFNKWGYCNQYNEIVIPYKFNDVSNFHEGFAIVTKFEEDLKELFDLLPEYGNTMENYADLPDYARIGNPQKGVINNKGELVVPFDYDSINSYIKGIAKAWKNGKGGYIDTSGKTVIPFIFDRAEDFSEGIARVGKNGEEGYKEGYINELGELIIPFLYEYVMDFDNGLARVRKENKYGIIDKTGKVIVPLKYESIDDFSEGLARVMDEEEYYGFVNMKGEEVIPCIYPEIGYFTEGFATVLNEKYGYIDTSGKITIPCIYEKALDFSEGLALVLDKKYGYIDRNGKTVIPFIFDYAGYFSEDLAFIEKGGKFGYIDRNGDIVIPCNYEKVWAFSDGIACVKKNDKYGLIDRIGQEICTCKYDEINSFSEGLARVRFDMKYGFIDKKGKEIIPLIYNKTAFIFKEGLAYVRI